MPSAVHLPIASEAPRPVVVLLLAPETITTPLDPGIRGLEVQSDSKADDGRTLTLDLDRGRARLLEDGRQQREVHLVVGDARRVTAATVLARVVDRLADRATGTGDDLKNDEAGNKRMTTKRTRRLLPHLHRRDLSEIFRGCLPILCQMVLHLYRQTLRQERPIL